MHSCLYIIIFSISFIGGDNTDENVDPCEYAEDQYPADLEAAADEEVSRICGQQGDDELTKDTPHDAAADDDDEVRRGQGIFHQVLAKDDKMGNIRGEYDIFIQGIYRY